MNREQRTPLRRQFIRPLSLVRDNVPATPFGTSVPLSQPVIGEQADPTKSSTQPVPAINVPEQPAQRWSPSPYAFLLKEAESQTDQSNTTSAEPISSSWMMPQNQPQTSALLAAQSDAALPQKEPTPFRATDPQGRGAASLVLGISDEPISDGWALPQTEPQFAKSAEPISSSWMTPQVRQPTSGHLGEALDAVSSQKEAISASWLLPQKGQQFVAAPLQAGRQFAATPPQTGQLFATSQTGSTSSSWTMPRIEESATVSQVAPIAPPQARKQTRNGINTSPAQQQKQRKVFNKKRAPLWFAVCSVIVVMMVVMTQGNGTVGAWAADTFRSVVGPVATAQIEAWYLNAQNRVQQWQFQMSGQHVASPWKLTPTAVRPTATPTPPAWATMKSMTLSPMQPIVSPALDGEGTWSVLEQAPGPYNYLPLNARSFIRPDPAFPYAIVTVLQFDTRFSRLHIVSGTQEPGGPLGAHGAGVITQTDREGNVLLAALNGGFKYADGAYGLMTNGTVYVPPQPKAATIAITREGQLLLGSWGTDPQLKSDNKDLVAWRQNASLLIDNGVINPLTKDGAAWGGTILNSEYTWRSGLGITAQGNLVYAAGNALVPETLGKALLAAGAVRAMETDINPFWVRAFLYQRGNNGKLTITKLNPQMQGTGYEYLNVDQRDFFYLTRYTPPINGAKPSPTPGKNK